MRYILLALFAILCEHTAEYLAERNAPHATDYTHKQVADVNSLVGRINAEHVDKGVLFRPKTAGEWADATADALNIEEFKRHE
jgi:hypothetical protein